MSVLHARFRSCLFPVLVLTAGVLAQRPVAIAAEPQLPPGAVARLGNTAWRPGAPSHYAAFLPDGKTLLAVTRDYDAVWFNLGTGIELRRLNIAGGPDVKPAPVGGNRTRDMLHPHAVKTLTSPDGKMLAAHGIDDVLRVWDLDAGKAVFTQTEKPVIPGMTFSGDSSRFATRSTHNQVTVYDTKTWKPVCTTPAPTEKSYAYTKQLKLSGDGKLLVESGQFPLTSTGSPRDQKAQVIVWDADTGTEKLRFGKELRPPSGNYANGIDGIDITPDGKLLVKPNHCDLALHDLTDGKEVGYVKNVLPDPGHVSTARFVDGGKKVVLHGSSNKGQLDTVLLLLDVETKKELGRVTLFWKSHLIKPWGTIDGEWPSANGKKLAVAYGTMLRVYDFETGRLASEVSDTPMTAVMHVQFTPDGKGVFTGTRDFDLYRWDVGTGKGEAIKVPGKPMFFSVLSPDGKTIVTGEQGAGSTVKVWDAASGELKAEPKLPAVAVRPGMPPDPAAGSFPRLSQGCSVFFTPDSNYFMLNQRDGPVRVFETATGKQVPKLGLEMRGTTSTSMGHLPVTFSPDSEWLITHGVSGTVAWDLPTETVETVARTISNDLRAMALSPDRRVLAQRTRSTNAPLNPPVFPGDPVRPRPPAVVPPVPFPDLQPIPPTVQPKQPKQPAAGDTKFHESLVLMELASGMPRTIIKLTTPENENWPPSVLFDPSYLQYTHLPPLVYSPDGRLVACGTADRKVRLFDVYTGKEAGAFAGHTGEVLSLAFSPDGTKLASGSADATALVWDLTDIRKKLTPPTAPLTDEQLKEAWAVLAHSEGRSAFGGTVAMLGDSAKTVPFLREKLAASGDAKRFPALIEALAGPAGPARDAAIVELDGLGNAAILPLKEAVRAKKITPELRAMVGKPGTLTTGGAYFSVGQLRVKRAIEVLDTLAAGGSKEAAELLKELATAPNDRPAVVEAHAVLQRLNRGK